MDRWRGQDFVYVGVNSDADQQAALRRAEEEGLTWTNVWCGPEGPRASLPSSWGVGAWPATFLLDRSGRIRFRGLRGEDLVAKIEQMLAEEPR